MNFISFRILPILLLTAAAARAMSGEHIIFSTIVEGCTLSVEYRDVEPTLLRLRALTANFSTCHVSKETMVNVLKQAFSIDELRQHLPRYLSLDVGRLVDYPWLSQYLAERADHHPGWDAHRNKPKTAPINRFVADILSSPEILQILNEAIREGGYCVTRASVEKVLVGRDTDIPDYTGPHRQGRRPFDSLTWFVLHVLEDTDCP